MNEHVGYLDVVLSPIILPKVHFSSSGEHYREGPHETSAKI
jgi:hypothetical protein